MPWTFAHPAAVLPLRRWCPRQLSLLGLVVGSCSPDIGYHLHRFDIATRAHTLAGLFVVCLPSGVLLAVLLQRFSRVLIQPLPQRHRDALTPLTSGAWPRGGRAWLALVVSVWLGALTHVVWDAFTHHSGWVVQHWALLREPLPGMTGPAAFHLLQHASSLVGALALLVAYRRFLRDRPPPAQPASDTGRHVLLVLMAAAALVGATPLALEAATLNGQIHFQFWVVRLAIDGATLFMGLYLLAALWLTWRPRPEATE
jgi:hypothetical protein